MKSIVLPRVKEAEPA